MRLSWTVKTHDYLLLSETGKLKRPLSSCAVKVVQRSVYKYRPNPPTQQLEDDLFRENTSSRAVKEPRFLCKKAKHVWGKQRWEASSSLISRFYVNVQIRGSD